jgi:hypothetical protein
VAQYLQPGSVRIQYQESGAEIVIRVKGTQQGLEKPLVLLIPAGEGGEPRVAELVKAKAGEMKAIFKVSPKDVVSGEYLLAFEPGVNAQ